MTELSAQIFFGGDSQVDPDDLGKTEVSNYTTSVDRALTSHFAWDESAIGCLGLALSRDNSKVTSGVFITRGVTGLSEYAVTCDQIWPGSSSNITLAVKIPTLNPFTFSGGGLWSDLIPSERFTVAFYNTAAGTEDRTVILGTPEGVGQFCLRLVCQPSSLSSGKRGIICKYTILLFPAAAQELGDTPESRFAGWPGLKVGDGHFPLGPRPTKKWQCPVLPLIRPGTPFADNSEAPESFRLRFAISNIMGKVYQPDAARSVGALMAKWEKIRSNPREILSKPPATCWPAAAPFQEERGKTLPCIVIN